MYNFTKSSDLCGTFVQQAREDHRLMADAVNDLILTISEKQCVVNKLQRAVLHFYKRPLPYNNALQDTSNKVIFSKQNCSTVLFVNIAASNTK